MKINVDKIEKKLKIKLRNKSLLVEAFTHKSSNSRKNNEKLEFLGDRVIGLVLSKKLFDLSAANTFACSSTVKLFHLNDGSTISLYISNISL